MISNNDSPIAAKVAGCCEDLKTHLDHNTTKSYSLFLRTKTYLFK